MARPTSATSDKTYHVTVNEVNQAPTLPVVADRAINQGLDPHRRSHRHGREHALANLDLQPRSRHPAGAAIDPNNGTFTWTPAEGAGPRHVRHHRASDGQRLTRPLRHDHFPRHRQRNQHRTTLPHLPDRTIDEQAAFSFSAAATDPDLPAQTLTYALDAGAAPVGHVDRPSDGRLLVDAYGRPGARVVRRYGPRHRFGLTSGMSATKTFHVTVNDVNIAPIVTAPGNRAIDEQTISASPSATDPDLPAGRNLTYSLDPGTRPAPTSTRRRASSPGCRPRRAARVPTQSPSACPTTARQPSQRRGRSTSPSARSTARQSSPTCPIRPPPSRRF